MTDSKIFELLGDGGELFLLADLSLNTVYISPSAQKELGSELIGVPVTEYMPSSEAFRLESFAGRRDKYEKIRSVELSLSNLRGFSFGYAVRQDVFSVPCVQIYLYKTKKDFLLSGKRSFAIFDTKKLLREMEQLREEIGLIAGQFPEKSRSIRRTAEDMYQRIIRSSLIQSLREEIADYPVFDLCSAVETALHNIAYASRREETAICDFSPSLLADRCSRVRISVENLICLVTAAFCLADSAAEREQVRLSAEISPAGDFCFSLSSSCPALCGLIPGEMGFAELESVIEGQEFSIFICDLICTRHGYPAKIRTEDGKLKLSFSVPPVRESGEFKSRDMMTVSRDYLTLCSDAFSESQGGSQA